MKKLLIILLFAFPAFAEGEVVPETPGAEVSAEEQLLFFPSKFVSAAINYLMPDEGKKDAADQYISVMNPETGKISIEGLNAVCAAGKFDLSAEEGIAKCKSFIENLLNQVKQCQESGEENCAEQFNMNDLGSFCPTSKKNSLRTITGATRTGDNCRSTNILSGYVFKHKSGKTCGCYSTACNPGFEFVRGQCKTIIADSNGFCLRSENAETDANNTTEKCKNFCEAQSKSKGCKFSNIVMRHSTKQCLCNADSSEVEAARASMAKAEEERLAKLPYYEVCGKDKGKGTCVSDIFNWTNVGQIYAVGLAQEYARVRLGKTIQCDYEYREAGNDDWIKCVSTDGKNFYEFKFDDVKESNDADLLTDLAEAICAIHNVESFSRALFSDKVGCASACTDNIAKTARIFDLTATNKDSRCLLLRRTMSEEESETELASIDGIDPKVFYHGIQIQGSQTIITKLKTYIQGEGITVKSFSCSMGATGKINKGWIKDNDDILRCYLNGQPVDFVFEDFSEGWLYVQEAGESGIQCILSKGVYQGSTCHGLTQEQCAKSDIALKKEFPGMSGTKWQNGQCVLVDASQAAKYDILVQVGVGLVSAVDCVILTHTGCALFVTEITGLVIEVETSIAIGDRAEDFIKESVKCKERSCAKSVVGNLAGKVFSVKSSLKPQDLHAVDSEFARLIGFLEPEDFQGDVSSSDWEEIIRQLGGDPDDTSGKALEIANKIGLVMQFASIGTSALRLTGKAIAKIGGKAAAAKNFGQSLVKAADNVNNLGKNAFVGAAAGTGRVFNNVSDAGAAFAAGSDDVIEFARKSIKPNEMSVLMRRAAVAGYECADCGGDILKFTKKAAPAPTPVASAANKADNVAPSPKPATDTPTPNAVAVSPRPVFKTPIDDILEVSGRQAVLRPASSNSLGADYYRIMVNDSDDISAVISKLQRQGYYVGANVTNDGQRFLGVAKEPIFGAWDNVPGNFLKNAARQSDNIMPVGAPVAARQIDNVVNNAEVAGGGKLPI
ncbi:MAG: hypothetical protein LBD50_04020 [Rickettsiales bacterium]|nr:hypothetical protein [Rickettsiales bacterium]